MKTSTGVFDAFAGDQTLRKRQSSVVFCVDEPLWGHSAPACVASRTPVHGVAGFGALKRSGPTGGAANGMPRKARTPFVTEPCTLPLSVCTTVGPPAAAMPAAGTASASAAARIERTRMLGAVLCGGVQAGDAALARCAGET